jgi:2-polyprenyl-3-methyl-5-hydroxy-6-metoxy-1,4-benzoquinol methylase
MINASIPDQGAAFSGYYESARHGLLALMPATAPREVLEIGCGAGATLAVIKARWPNCQVVGVELRAEAIDVARRGGLIDEILQGDVLDRTSLDFARGRFDVIVLSHVLEHFAQPELVLERARRWLSPAGCLLVALPNVRHLSLLVELVLKADFQYQPAGILDRTHLRFYTRKSALRFLTENGWHVEACTPEIDGPKSRALQRWSFGLANDLAAYAYNFRVRAA